MTGVHVAQSWIQHLSLPSLLIIGLLVLAGFYSGRSMKYFRLPSIIGFMIIGVISGPSLLNILNETFMARLSFITEIALGFVAVTIGMELKFSMLKRQGSGIASIILSETFLAFILVTFSIFLLTRDLPLSLLFGAIAPASAPAGTVAVIQEYKARGSLTKTLYSVVGFDDGLGIIIFGFAASFARSIVLRENGGSVEPIWGLVRIPLIEVGLSVVAGAAIALLFSLLARKMTGTRDIFILTFAFVLISTGISNRFHFSVILTNMVLGIVVVNTQPGGFIQRIRTELTEAMPLLFILFFMLAGANLNISLLPSLGLLGIIYILSRSAGLMGGAWLGAWVSKAEEKIKKYLGLGILSQAGVAIGLALIVKREFSILNIHGAEIGSTIITTITATSIIFEIIGPILTKVGLEKAGEIPH